MADECPNCGEPISSDARVCPFCGSDEETGWHPDADYYGVELPEDDFFSSEEGPPSRFVTARWPGALLLFASAAFFVWTTISAYSWSGLVPIAFLGLASLWLELGTRPPRESARGS
ncbi:MAG TPA: zinc ribbon domain-containing protein [Planctomycetota bacterium]|nr:zinc ribbon domain-containing protein [Planctomycetota bacterium]